MTSPDTRHRLDRRFVGQVALLALRGLDPRDAIRRPVLLALELAALAATVLFAGRAETQFPRRPRSSGR